MPRDDRRIAALALIALLPLLLWDLAALDLPAARLFGTAHGFAWRDDWWLNAVLHDSMRYLAWAMAFALLLNVFWPLTHRLTRGERLWWFLATLAGAAVVPLIKQQSLTSCPWDLDEFGGAAQHLSHWLQFRPWGQADGGGGRCFPSGHATSAFCFFSGAFALRRAHPVAARRSVWGVLVLGLLLGLVQLARGAHFPSHTLWSAWICFGLNLMMSRWLPQEAPNSTAALGQAA